MTKRLLFWRLPRNRSAASEPGRRSSSRGRPAACTPPSLGTPLSAASSSAAETAATSTGQAQSARSRRFDGQNKGRPVPIWRWWWRRPIRWVLSRSRSPSGPGRSSRQWSTLQTWSDSTFGARQSLLALDERQKLTEPHQEERYLIAWCLFNTVNVQVVNKEESVPCVRVADAAGVCTDTSLALMLCSLNLDLIQTQAFFLKKNSSDAKGTHRWGQLSEISSVWLKTLGGKPQELRWEGSVANSKHVWTDVRWSHRHNICCWQLLWPERINSAVVA